MLQKSPADSLETSPLDNDTYASLFEKIREACRVLNKTRSDVITPSTDVSVCVPVSGEIPVTNREITRGPVETDSLKENLNLTTKPHQPEYAAQIETQAMKQQDSAPSDLNLAVAASRRGIDLLEQLNKSTASTSKEQQMNRIENQNPELPLAQLSSALQSFVSIEFDAMLQSQDLQSAPADLMQNTQSEAREPTQLATQAPRPQQPRPQETQSLPQVTRKYSAARVDLTTRFGNQQPMASSSPKTSVGHEGQETAPQTLFDRTQDLIMTTSCNPKRISNSTANLDESTVSSINVDKALRGMGLVEDGKSKSGELPKETIDKDEIIREYLREVARKAGISLKVSNQPG